jgi:hypothetical protein
VSAGHGAELASLAPRDAVWLLSHFALLNQRTIDPDALARECIPPLCIDDLCRVGAKLDLIISSSNAAIDLTKSQLPIAVQVGRPSGSADDSSEWLLVLQIESKGALVAKADGNPPQHMPVRQL